MKKQVAKTTPNNQGEKYVTEKRFDAFAVSVSKRFDQIDKKFEGVDQKLNKLDGIEAGMNTLIKQMQTMNEESREHRLAMSALTHSDVKQERKIDELFERIEKIERKIAIK